MENAPAHQLCCHAPRLDKAHWALAESIAAIIGLCLSQHLAAVREQGHRIATEAALVDHNKRLMLLVDYLPALIHAHDAEGRYVFWNKECERVTGYSAQEMLGDFQRGIPWLYGAYDNPLEKFGEMHSPCEEYRDKELTLRCADGQFKTFTWTNISKQCPIPGWDCWEVGVEITDRKRAEHALQNQLHLVETLLHAVPYPLYIKDNSLRYLGCNAAFSSFVGRSEEEVKGKTATDLWGAELMAAIEAHDLTILESQQSSLWHGRLPDAEGALRDVSIQKGVFRSYDGRVSGLVCVLSDITEQRRYERKLLKAKREAEEASQAKTRFLANVSHELRTPLNGVMGATDLLQAEGLGSEQQELLGIIRASTTSLLRVLNDLLDLASLDQGSLSISPQPMDFHRALESLFKLFSVQAHWKRLQFSYDIDPRVPKMALLDSQRLRQAVTNCFWNALKFTETGSVRIRVAPLDASWSDFSAEPVPPAADGAVASGPAPPELTPVVISIEDTGIGISPEQQASIFEAFTLAEDVMTKKHGGLGLGLAISHKLVQLMGGRLWVESELDQGATFHMLLPLETC